MKTTALITAGGIGKRMGSAAPKQYLDLGGVPVLVRTVMAFENHPLVENIVITVPQGDEEKCRSTIVGTFGAQKVTEIVAGGPTRQASVYNGLQRIERAEIVVIHDGVRPLVSRAVITQTIESALTSGAALACAPVAETVKKKIGSRLETVPRSDLWLAHTPQAFELALILEAHRKAVEDGFHATDDSVLVERLGRPVSIVEDSVDNLKITTSDDLQRAGLLLERQSRMKR